MSPIHSALVTFRKIRIFGLTGILNYLLDIPRWFLHYLFLYANALLHPCRKPEKGITLIGDFSGKGSLAKVLRDFVMKLDAAGIPHQTYNTAKEKVAPTNPISAYLTRRRDFRLLRYSHLIDIFTSTVKLRTRRARGRIIFWEFQSGFREMYPEYDYAQHVITMSDFNHRYLRSVLPASVKVSKILYPFLIQTPTLPDHAGIREKYGIPQDAFVAFFNFDYGSSFVRKNPDGAMRAFDLAFHDVPDAWLVFKTMGAKSHPQNVETLRALAAERGLAHRFLSIDTYIPQDDLYGLTNACDVYVSLHRGEGFGLGIAEAMTLGKAVVATDYSSTTEFCRPDTALLVPYAKTAVKSGALEHPCYKYVSEWAEPDEREAAKLLRRLYDDPALREKLGRQARAFVRDYFSVENFRKSIDDFLNT